MEIPKFFQDSLTEMGGRTAHGEPRLKVSDARELRETNGRYKYPNPYNTKKPMECFVIETWLPPTFFEPREQWNEELLGAFPSRGRYVLKTPLMTGDGKPLPLTEETLNCVKAKQLADIQWNQMDAKDRLEDLERRQREQEEREEEIAQKETQDVLQHWDTHQAQLDNADSRVWSFPQHLDSIRKNGKMPVR